MTKCSSKFVNFHTNTLILNAEDGEIFVVLVMTGEKNLKITFCFPISFIDVMSQNVDLTLMGISPIACDVALMLYFIYRA